METRVFGGKDDKKFWSGKPIQKGHPDFKEEKPDILEEQPREDDERMPFKKEKLVTEISGVGNYYGSLHVKKESGKHYMKVFCEISSGEWKSIKKSLYGMLIASN